MAKNTYFLVSITLTLAFVLSSISALPSLQITTQSSTWHTDKCTGNECNNFSITIKDNGNICNATITPKDRNYWSSSDWSTLNLKVYVGDYKQYYSKNDATNQIVLNKTGNGASTKVYSVMLNCSLYNLLQIGNNTIIETEQNNSAIIYSGSDFQVTTTLQKYNGLNYITAPQDVWIANESDCIAKNKVGVCYGATDYLPYNNSELALNNYLYTYNSSKEINYDGENYFIYDGLSLWQWINQFFGNYVQTKTLIQTNDICNKGYSNCTYILSNDSKTLSVYFTAQTIDGKVEIDPAYNLQYSSSSAGQDMLQVNATESSNLGARLSAPVLFLDFNNPAESTADANISYIKDNSIYNNYGTIGNITGILFQPIYNATGGYDGSGAYEFDGVDDIITASLSSVPTIPYTLSAWVKLNTTAGNQEVFLTTTGRFVDIGAGSCSGASKIGWRINDGSYLCSGATTILNNQWHKIDMVAYSAINSTIYYDGLPVASVAGQAPAFTSPLRIGGNYNGFFNGSIDQVQVWNRALSASEILNLYNGTINNSNYIGKYSNQGNFQSLVFYNSTSTYWNTTFNIADTYSTRTGIVTTNNEINLSDPNLVSYWKLDGNYNDAKGINNGTPVSRPISYGFTPTSTYPAAKASMNNSLVNASELTMSIWVYAVSHPPNVLFDIQNPNTGFDDTTGDNRMYVNGTLVGRPGFNLNQWTHLVISWKSGSFTNLFVNNVKTAGTVVSANITQNARIRFANPDWSTNGQFAIQEAAIWSRALNDSEVAELYNSGNGLYINPNNNFTSTNNSQGLNLTRLWHIQDGSGTNFIESIVGDNATIQGTGGWIIGNINNETSPIPTSTNNATGISSSAMLFNGVNNVVNLTITSLQTSQSWWVKNSSDTGWHHYVNSSGTYYQDGQVITAANVQNIFGVLGNVFIGQKTPIYYYTGAVDEITFYNKSLTAAEVTQLYKSGLSQHATTNVTLQVRTASNYNISDPNLVAFYDFNGNDIVVDEMSSAFWKTGTWTNYCSYAGFHACQWYSGGAAGSSFAYWNFTVPTTGTYNVYMMFGASATANEASNAPFTTATDNGNKIVAINQRSVNGTWNLLGNYNFTTGRIYNVTLNNSADQRVWADAILVSSTDINYIVDKKAGINNLTNYGATQSSSYGLVGSGYFFNTTNSRDYMATGTTSMLNGAGQITFSAWVNPQTLKTAGIVWSRSGTDVSGIYMPSTTGTYDCRINGQIIAATPAGYITAGKWRHIVCVWSNTSAGIIYVDGINVTTSGAIKAGTNNQNTPFWIGADTSTGWANSYIDEVRIYNRSLSASEVLDLYNLGATHIEDWSNWTNETIVQDGVPQTTLTSGEFMQFKSNLYSNDTSVSPYIINYSVSSTPSPVTPDVAPSVIFNTQVPADINSINAFASGVNITYNITDTDITGLNLSTIQIFYMHNSTTRDCITFINGTCTSGFNSENYISNASSTFLWNLGDDDIYPTVANIDPETAHNSLHKFLTLTTQTRYVKVQFENVTSTTQYNFLEVMVNASTSANNLNFYYCNSSYSTGNINTDGSCAIATTWSPTPNFNYTDNQSKYKIIPLAINITSGRLAGIIVTPTSYFLLQGSNTGGGRYVYYTDGGIRTGAVQTTINNGLVWTENNTIIPDMMLHQFSGNSSLYYYVCANDTSSPPKQNCSETRQDLFDLAGLPPTAPMVYSPTNTTYFISVPINYTPAVSPNDYPISNYTIELLNSDLTLNKTLEVTTNLYSNWTIDLYGSFVIHVKATDNQSQTSDGYSDVFSTVQTYIQTNIDKTSPQEYPNAITINCDSNDGVDPKTLTVDGLDYTSQIGNPIILGVGTHTINCTIDGLNNVTTFDINQNTTYLLGLEANPSWTGMIGDFITITGTNCPSELTCNLYEDNVLRINPFTDQYFNGSFSFVYNTTGNENYTSFSINNTLIISGVPPVSNVTRNNYIVVKFGSPVYVTLGWGIDEGDIVSQNPNIETTLGVGKDDN